MRKPVFLILAASLIGSACQGPRPHQGTPPNSKPSATWTPPPAPQRHAQAPSGPPPAAQPPPRFHEGWYPRGGKLSRRWTTVILHHSATDTGGARTFDRHHRSKGWDELGYHFVIGNGTDTPDGFIEVGSRWHSQKHGAHCKTPSNYYNDHGIGVCLVGDFTRTRPTAKQLESLNRLTRFLTQACGISPDRVTTHGAVTHGTQCPGRNFPLTSLRRRLANPALASSVPWS